MKNIEEFEKQIGIPFENSDLLKRAFTHRSYLNENRDSDLLHNERLEFLGDAVLELVATHFLFVRYPDKAEGELTAVRAALVNTTNLSNVAGALNMNDFLLLSRGESKDTGRARQFILANTVEAVIGAIYLDQGYDVTQSFIEKHLFNDVDTIIEKKLWQDAKSAFQEKAQEIEGVTPEYKTLEAQGPDHDRHFMVGVYLGDELVAKGEGKAKQEAQQEAAERALKKRDWR